MIKQYSLLALQKAINYALSLDDTMPDKLAPLHGKLVEIIIAPLDVRFFMAFETQQLHLLTSASRPADTTIRSNPLGLIRLSFLPASKTRSLFNDTVTLSGDTQLGQDIKRLFDSLDIDWEGHLAHFTGDVVAYHAGSLVRKGKQLQAQISHSLRDNLAEYLQEESQMFPPKEEVMDFFHDVDALAMDVERLQAHINRIVTPDEID